VIGGFMKFLPITLISTLSASLVMALIFIPTLGGALGSANAHTVDEQRRIAAAETGDLGDLRGGSALYLKALSWAIDHPRKTFVIASRCSFSIFGAYSFLGAGVELFPNGEPDGVRVNVHARGDLSVYEKDKLVREVEARILDIPDLESVNGEGRRGRTRDSPDAIGTIRLPLQGLAAATPDQDIVDEVRARTGQHARCVCWRSSCRATGRVRQAGCSCRPPRQCLSRSTIPIAAWAKRSRRSGSPMDKVGGLPDSRTPGPLDGLEWHLDVNRAEAAKYGADHHAGRQCRAAGHNGVLLGKSTGPTMLPTRSTSARATPRRTATSINSGISAADATVAGAPRRISSSAMLHRA